MGKKEKKSKGHSVQFDLANDDVFSMEHMGRPSDEHTGSILSLAPDEEVQMHFNRGIELLQKLNATNPILAQSIADSIQASLAQLFVKTGQSTPAAHSVGSSSPLRVVKCTNPFDFLPTIPYEAPIHVRDTPPRSTSVNPFDFFQ